jgi:hypothetical protein
MRSDDDSVRARNQSWTDWIRIRKAKTWTQLQLCSLYNLEDWILVMNLHKTDEGDVWSLKGDVVVSDRHVRNGSSQWQVSHREIGIGVNQLSTCEHDSRTTKEIAFMVRGVQVFGGGEGRTFQTLLGIGQDCERHITKSDEPGYPVENQRSEISMKCRLHGDKDDFRWMRLEFHLQLVDCVMNLSMLESLVRSKGNKTELFDLAAFIGAMCEGAGKSIALSSQFSTNFALRPKG